MTEETDKKGTYITIFMLIMMAILFFSIGYGIASNKQVVDCNNFIEKEILPTCPGYNIVQTPQIIGGEYEKIKFSDFNFTQN